MVNIHFEQRKDNCLPNLDNKIIAIYPTQKIKNNLQYHSQLLNNSIVGFALRLAPSVTR
jgi:hypothetical protein